MDPRIYVEKGLFRVTISSSDKLFGVSVLMPVLFLLLTIRYRQNIKIKKGGKVNEDENEKFSKWGDLRISWWQALVSPLRKLWYLYKVRKDGLRIFEEYVQENGPVSRIGKTYVIADPTVIKKILTSPNPLDLTKTSVSGVVFRLGGIKDGLAAATPDIWAPHRKLLNPSFSYKRLRSFVGRMNRSASDMVEAFYERLEEISGDRNQVVFEIVNFHMIKMISGVLLGAEDMVSDEESVKFGQNFERTKELCVFRAYRPWLINEATWKLHPYREEFERTRQGMHQCVKNLIAKYRELQLDTPTDLEADEEDLDKQQYHSMIQDMMKSGMTEHEIVLEVLTFLIGGHETVTSLITLLLYHLAMNPSEQLKCLDEINEVSPPSDNSNPFFVSMDDLSNLKHLERCMFETLRLTPPAALVTRRIISGLEVDESLKIEPGSDVLIPVWCVHRSEMNYKDPYKFDPDRFLPENTKLRHRFAFLPFSAGPRQCIGSKLALMEAKVVVAWVLRNFEVETGDKNEEVKWMFDGVSRAEGGLDLRLKKRIVNEI